MNKKLFKHAASFLLLLILVAPSLVLAQNANTYFPTGQNLNLPTNDLQPVTVITNIINIFLGLLGLLAVIIVLIGGFKWMTANGVEDKVKSAKKTIEYGLIGMGIILLSYIIVKLVLNAIYRVGTGSTTLQ
ncbi:MAG TPA: pilin [bacterium]|nr:pilin [bacterium]